MAQMMTDVDTSASFEPLARWEELFDTWASAFRPTLFEADNYFSEPAAAIDASPTLKLFGSFISMPSTAFVTRTAGVDKLLERIAWRFYKKIQPALYTPTYTLLGGEWAHAFALNGTGLVIVRINVDADGTTTIIQVNLFRLFGDETVVANSLPLVVQSYELAVDSTDGSTDGEFFPQALNRLLRPSGAIEPSFNPDVLGSSNGADAYFVLIDLLYNEFVSKPVGYLMSAPNILIRDAAVARKLANMEYRGVLLLPLYWWLGESLATREMVDLKLEALVELKAGLAARTWIVDQDSDATELAVEARENFLVDVCATLLPPLEQRSLRKIHRLETLTLDWYQAFFTLFWQASFVADLKKRIDDAVANYNDGTSDQSLGIDYRPHGFYDERSDEDDNRIPQREDLDDDN